MPCKIMRMRWGVTRSPIQLRGVQVGGWMDGCKYDTIKSLTPGCGFSACRFKLEGDVCLSSWQLTFGQGCGGREEGETREISVTFHDLMRRYPVYCR
jgi:hypothetical protein